MQGTPADDRYPAVSTSTRGLRFLKQLLPALDSLEPDTYPISKFTSASSRFIVGNTDRVTSAADLHNMFKSRASMLESFNHKVTRAWEVTPNSASPTSTEAVIIIFESVSTTVLKADKKKHEVEVKEVSILELEEAKGDGGVGVEGLVIKEIRSYLDPKPVMDAMQSHADVRIVKD